MTIGTLSTSQLLWLKKHFTVMISRSVKHVVSLLFWWWRILHNSTKKVNLRKSREEKFRGEKVRQKVFKGFSDGNQIDKSIRMFLIAFRD